jgi:hypothetical protein
VQRRGRGGARARPRSVPSCGAGRRHCAAPAAPHPRRAAPGRLCPFAQRTLIALNAKGCAFTLHELSEADLYDKPAWFLDLNPAGLVPTLAWRTGGQRRVLTESLILNE